MLPKKSENVRDFFINNIEDTRKVFPDWFIPRKLVNFQSLMEEGFVVNGLFNCVGWKPFL